MEANNGSGTQLQPQPKGLTCSQRTGEKPHCWHSSGAPVRNTKEVVLFHSVCCWCAPEYMHIEVMILANVSDTEIVAAQMEHGPLVAFRRGPKIGPQLTIPGR